jgi:hypothetical protein
LVSNSNIFLVSIHKSIPQIHFCFQSYPEKATQKIRIRSSCHSVNCIEVFVLVAGRRSFCVAFSISFSHPSVVFIVSFRSFPIMIHSLNS